ncbi:XkdF-like putative serine protease domain-containing protein [Bacillus sp. REN10]|uniref:XkdF-like putative serine protease domain-containing protein n=1 Tax=Bacillus sp. REN10 TaxID=2782541 RepID=UPI00193AE65F|nr:XkdF-like putative serine protease domain-containing protein [Bacillus sp. REN10]
MGRELINANITHVSYVDKGANQKQFFFTKSAKQPDFQKEVKLFINKEEEEQQLVYGLVYEPDVEDSHGDFMTAAEIEKAAHGFMKDARNIDKQHDFNAGVGEVVESYIAPADFTIGEQTITKGSWVLVTKASDEIWEEIKKGAITGYSMAGTAETIEKQNEKPAVISDKGEAGLFNMLKSFFTGEQVQKGAVRDDFERKKKHRDFWAAQSSFEGVIRSYNWRTDEVEFEQDEAKLREAIEDYVSILNDILLTENVAKSIGEPPENIEKAGKKISAARMDKINAAFDALNELKAEVEEEEEEEVKKEDIAKMLDEKLSPITKRLDAIEKEEGDGAEPSAEEELLKQFSAALDEKLTPINDRLEAVEKARGISKQSHEEESAVPVQKSAGPSYMRHFG